MSPQIRDKKAMNIQNYLDGFTLIYRQIENQHKSPKTIEGCDILIAASCKQG